MDLDVTQVRAFVATADRRHFGRAASELFLTQQAVSKRIQRLEQALGAQLLTRGSREVGLTDAGQRFLPYARELLAVAAAAAAAAHPPTGPLRLDVWGHAQAPLRAVRHLLVTAAGLTIEPSMRRSLDSALQAMARDEIDACFGQAHNQNRPLPSGLAHQPMLLERMAVAVSTRHPLAGKHMLSAHDLTDSPLWVPAAGTPGEVLAMYQQCASYLGVALDTSGHNLGLDHAVRYLRQQVHVFTLMGTEWADPIPDGIRLVRLRPAPCGLWSLIWPEHKQNPVLQRFLNRAAQIRQDEEWLACDPQRDWLPETALSRLRREGLPAA